MNLMPTNLGAEPKKIAILVGVLLVGGVVYWRNSTSDETSSSSAAPVPAATTPAIPSLNTSLPNTNQPSVNFPASGPKLQTRGKGRSIEDFRPSLKVPEGTDMSTIDPTLKLALLAKVRAVADQSGPRSLFEFYTPPPPPPKVDPIKPVPPPVTTQVVKPPTVPTGPPPPPPIPLKFYGFAGASKIRGRQAFFLDGEDILMAAENETVRSRYKIIRIGTADAEVEDTVSKSRQTLPIVAEIP